MAFSSMAGVSEAEMDAIQDLLRAEGAMTPDAVASELRLDEAEVPTYLANLTALNAFDYHSGTYSIWHWL